MGENDPTRLVYSTHPRSKGQVGVTRQFFVIVLMPSKAERMESPFRSASRNCSHVSYSSSGMDFARLEARDMR